MTWQKKVKVINHLKKEKLLHQYPAIQPEYVLTHIFLHLSKTWQTKKYPGVI